MNQKKPTQKKACPTQCNHVRPACSIALEPYICHASFFIPLHLTRRPADPEPTDLLLLLPATVSRCDNVNIDDLEKELLNGVTNTVTNGYLLRTKIGKKCYGWSLNDMRVGDARLGGIAYLVQCTNMLAYVHLLHECICCTAAHSIPFNPAYPVQYTNSHVPYYQRHP